MSTEPKFLTRSLFDKQGKFIGTIKILLPDDILQRLTTDTNKQPIDEVEVTEGQPGYNYTDQYFILEIDDKFKGEIQLQLLPPMTLNPDKMSDLFTRFKVGWVDNVWRTDAWRNHLREIYKTL